MSNGRLIQDMKKTTKRSKKTNNRLKNATSDLNQIAERASEANPFIWKKDINVWLTDEGLLYIRSWANDGLTNEELAKKMGIGETTLYRWCNTDGRIRDAIIRGRDTMTMNVENMLYKCAMGYTYEEEALTKDGDIVTIQRYAPPSAEAQKFILTNRRKDKWKSKQEVALEAQAQIQAQAQVDNKIITAEDVAKSIIGDEEETEFDIPGADDDEVMNNG